MEADRKSIKTSSSGLQNTIEHTHNTLTMSEEENPI